MSKSDNAHKLSRGVSVGNGHADLIDQTEGLRGNPNFSKQLKPSFRLASIDIFRSLTMFLMIFVNDLWTLSDIPVWLGHTAADEDAMGLADVVFPVFLFIVGLSIPYAISNRTARGDSTAGIMLHIAERSFALLLMGLFIVNLENINGTLLPIDRRLWQVSMILAFFLIWNAYPAETSGSRRFLYVKAGGYLLLVVLAILYRSGTAEEPAWMKVHWWGILGLIGWAYVVCAVVYTILRDRPTPILMTWLFFVGFNVAEFAGYLDPLNTFKEYVWPANDASMAAFTMAGVCATVLLRSGIFSRRSAMVYVYALIGIGLLCLLSALELRPYWGISKIRATPAWVGMCTGISFIVYAFLYLLTDVKGVVAWSNWLKPAGVATLTCYFLPYLWYPFIDVTGLQLPDIALTGIAGLVKSLLFSCLMLWFTSLLIKRGIRLRI
jgi:heparan-alpha-glucosaminide N-acetyltransferase